MTLWKLLILPLFLLFIACSPKQNHKSLKTKILTSIAPYRFLTEQIAGDQFEVETIVPVSADPHSFEPTAQQVASIARGVVWFQIGEPFEGKIYPILKAKNPNLAVKDLRQGIALIEEGPFSCAHCSMDHYDRHIWLSPKMTSFQAEMIEELLSELFPENRALFKQNLKALQDKLGTLDVEIQEKLASVEKRVLLVSHPAFGYFCKDYEFEQLSVEYEGREPRPKHIEELLSRASTEKMNLALALPQYNNKGVQLIAEKLHMPVRFINPYSENYFETLRKLTYLIADPYAK